MSRHPRPIHTARQQRFANSPSAFAQAASQELGYKPADLLSLIRIGIAVRDGRYIGERDVADLQRIYPAIPRQVIVDRVYEINASEPRDRFALLVHHLSGGGQESVDFTHKVINDFERHEASIAVERRLDERSARIDERNDREPHQRPPGMRIGDGSVRGEILHAMLKGQRYDERSVRNGLADTVEQTSERLAADAQARPSDARSLRDTIQDSVDMESAVETGKDLGYIGEDVPLHEWQE